jgi:hypothetical protein
VDQATGTPVITLWRERFRFYVGELHFHRCPECYEDGPCMMNCEWEPEMSEGDEPMRGSHCQCDACRVAP